MTGEIDLHGNILTVGGIKEKLLAAKKNNVLNIFMPLQNKHDTTEIKEFLEDMNIHYIDHVEEVLKIIFKDENKYENLNKDEILIDEIANLLTEEEQCAI